MRNLLLLLTWLLGAMASVAGASVPTYRVYVDADMSHLRASGDAIVAGVRAALSEVGGLIHGRKVEVVVLDHRRNTRRSEVNLKKAFADPNTLFVVGGIHSPCILGNRSLINRSGVPFFVPWAAAGAITRPAEGEENWIFRCSVDDSKAAKYLADQVVSQRGLRHPFLLLENTAWGRGNLEGLHVALRELNVRSRGEALFPWNLADAAVDQFMTQVRESGADSIILVANPQEGAVLCHALHRAEIGIPVIGHWGITAGNFSELVPHEVRSRLELSFLQTRFSFLSYPEDPLGKVALELGGFTKAQEVRAPVGFIHSFDLGRIGIAAANQAEFSGEMVSDRRALKKALESLQTPVPGLVKTYTKPFSKYSIDQADAHEALGPEDFAMASFDEFGQIYLVDPETPYSRDD